jgi:hypothetical protein
LICSVRQTTCEYSGFVFEVADYNTSIGPLCMRQRWASLKLASVNGPASCILVVWHSTLMTIGMAYLGATYFWWYVFC